MGSRHLFLGAAALIIGLTGAALAAPNGSGPDPDGDTNPATDARLFPRIGDAAEAAYDPPWQVITFEAPPGSHGDVISDQYASRFGVKFGSGLKRQICKGPRYGRYDSQCTYLAAPSGYYAGLFRNDYRRPLVMRFDKPACAAAIALYPTGGEEGEPYEITLQPYNAAGKMTPVKYQFNWTHDTFRWRLVAEWRPPVVSDADRAMRMDVAVKSLKDEKKAVRFLIDDVAFREKGCTIALADVRAEAGAGER